LNTSLRISHQTPNVERRAKWFSLRDTRQLVQVISKEKKAYVTWFGVRCGQENVSFQLPFAGSQACLR